MSAPKPTRKPPPATPRTPIRDEVLAAIAASGLTGAELARQVGRSPSTVNRFLAGSKDWTIAVLEDVAPILNLRLVPVNRTHKTSARRKSRPGG